MTEDQIWHHCNRLTTQQRKELGILNRIELVHALQMEGRKISLRTLDRMRGELPTIRDPRGLTKPRDFFRLAEVSKHLDASYEALKEMFS